MADRQWERPQAISRLTALVVMLLVAALQARGHSVMRRAPFTSANTIVVTPRGLVGAADPRTRGALAVGY